MGYCKTIKYANILELYEYEKYIEHFGRTGRKVQATPRLQDLDKNGANPVREGEQRQVKRGDNARRSAMVFRRLVSANLAESTNPLLVSLTYADNFKDIRQGHKDFNTFARNVRSEYGKHVRYIAVPEFQKRGAVHFHALFWGLPNEEIVKSERRTRLVARLWSRGFVDVTLTDGDHKISGYLSKYMSKAFVDSRMLGMKAYICSQNIKRPIVEKNPLILPMFYGGLLQMVDLSTALLLREKEYMTQWLGKGRFRLYELKH